MPPQNATEPGGRLPTSYRTVGPLPTPEEWQPLPSTAVRKTASAAKSVEADPKPDPRPCAIFVAHGMGQQIPFQTLDDIAQALRQKEASKLGVALEELPHPVTCTVRVQDGDADVTLQRVELRLKTPEGSREVHVYEGYWAPLTEGVVTLRDVLGFLLLGARNGLSNGAQPFRRWLFGAFRELALATRTAKYLLVALLVVLSLVAMNTVVLAVAAARAPFVNRPGWLSQGLIADLTTVFNAVLAALLVFALLLVYAKDLQTRGVSWKLRQGLAAFTNVIFFLVLLVVAAAGCVVLPWLLREHRRPIEPGEAMRRWTDQGGWPCFDAGFGTGLLSLLGILAAFALGFLLWIVFRRGALKRPKRTAARKTRGRFPVLSAAATFVVAVFAGSFWFVSRTAECSGAGLPQAWRISASWLVLVAASAFIRSLLVQYVGDVAVYVAPHTLDRFNDTRSKIKDCVYRQARAVFALGNGKAYSEVVIVGHSLGSVIVYDALNRLINEDEIVKREKASRPPFLDVLGRTRMLLTFGSPLDKIAYLFALQGNRTSEAREALAAEVQPLIRNFGFRGFEWINIWSRWDIISGSLDFYDTPLWDQLPHETDDPAKIRSWVEKRKGRPAWRRGLGCPKDNPEALRFDFGGSGPKLEPISWEDFFAIFEAAYLKLQYDPESGEHRLVSRYRVDNVEDRDATTLLAAHTEYWHNTTLIDKLYGALSPSP